MLLLLQSLLLDEVVLPLVTAVFALTAGEHRSANNDPWFLLPVFKCEQAGLGVCLAKSAFGKACLPCNRSSVLGSLKGPAACSSF
jgi:hypothetical protein